jgi:hypothetical protein
MQKADVCIVIRHVGSGGFDGSPVRLREQCCLLTLLFYQVMNCAHASDILRQIFVVSVDFTSRS